jgi:TolB-like protein
MLRRAIALTALATVAVSAAPIALRAQGSDQRPTVAVLYFNNNSIGKDRNDYENIGRGVSDFLITELSANGGIRVVERDQIGKITAEQDLGASNRIDAETAVKLGKLLGARYLVTGGFMAMPKGGVRLDARAIETETGKIVHTESVSDNADNVVTMIGTLASKLNKGMKLPDIPKRMGAAPASTPAATPGSAPAAQQMAMAEPEQKVPFAAVMLYSKAIAAKDKGNKNEAVTLFKASIEKFPEFAKAKTELKKLGA